ncbi:MAG TPA: flagellar biosynthesis protein FlgC [Alphaproteobacteria bacterium]|nr:flagellar biosynthesis protein FlgC [Alphaproteobacteria bacterium]
MSSILNIAVSGLNAASAQIANATKNIVNASSTGALPNDEGQNYTGYTPTDVVTLSTSTAGANLGVTTTTVPRSPAYSPAYDPNSPNANAQGLVGAPNVDLTSEIVSSKVSQVNYAADAAIIRIENKDEKALLDIKT